MTAGIAGKFSRVRTPEPWTGAEKDEGITGWAATIAVGAAVTVAVVALAAAAAEDDLAAAKFTSRRALEEATLTLRPPTVSPRRGEAVAPATRRARVVVNCIVKFEAIKRLIAWRHRRVWWLRWSEMRSWREELKIEADDSKMMGIHWHFVLVQGGL
jgi:hypothetical protein